MKRKCKWENCKKLITTGRGRLYCEKHQLHSFLKRRIRLRESEKILYGKLKEMKKEVYVKLCKELQEKVLKELKEEEKKLK